MTLLTHPYDALSVQATIILTPPSNLLYPLPTLSPTLSAILNPLCKPPSLCLSEQEAGGSQRLQGRVVLPREQAEPKGIPATPTPLTPTLPPTPTPTHHESERRNPTIDHIALPPPLVTLTL